MHPYQDQIDKVGDFLELEMLARKCKCWLEAISISYILLEIMLRLLLSSKAGTSQIPIPPKTINDQNYLMRLANLARDNGFMDETIWKRTKEFNEVRKKAIHGLAQGEISYSELKGPALSTRRLMAYIDACRLRITFGQEETRPPRGHKNKIK